VIYWKFWLISRPDARDQPAILALSFVFVKYFLKKFRARFFIARPEKEREQKIDFEWSEGDLNPNGVIKLLPSDFCMSFESPFGLPRSLP
jgi:hypothetical protein